jgi:AraC-like DNA-binding protein
MTVGEVAARLGYASDAAFSRAFKRFMGAAPRVVRSGFTSQQSGNPTRQAEDFSRNA